ncbi:MAG TPA: DUF2723 domain-containing protein [bacterium]|nr:DUF2723 domain-containing protein [bacterium]
MKSILYSPARLTFLVAFAAYLALLCPDLAWEDSGEFITASRCLGVPHTPGSPVYVILGKRLTCPPFGSVAFRVNLLSAFFTATAASLFCLFLYRRISERQDAGWIAMGLSLSWAFSPWVMRHALAAEVYGLAWTCLMGIFLLEDEYQRRNLRGPCSFYVLLGLLTGIGVSTSVLLIPLAFLLCVLPFVDRRGAWISISRFGVGFILGVLPLALPLLRSGQPPPLYQADAETLPGLIRFLFGGQFENQVWEGVSGFNWTAVFGAVVGALLLVLLAFRSGQSRRLWWIAALGAINLTFVFFHRHPGHFFAPCLACALALAAHNWPGRMGRWLVPACLAAVVFWSWYSPVRTGEIPLRWVQRSIREIPSGSRAYLGEINAVFPHLYSTVIQQEPTGLQIHPVWNSTRAEQLQDVLNAEGPVYVDTDLMDYSTRTRQIPDPFSNAVPQPILLRVYPPDSANWDGWWRSERDWLRENQPRMTRLDRQILGNHYFNLAVFCLERGIAVGEDLIGLARGLNPDLPRVPPFGNPA